MVATPILIHCGRRSDGWGQQLPSTASWIQEGGGGVLMSTEIVGLLVILAILALGTVYAFKGSSITEQWWSWIRRASLASGLVFGIGILTLGLPGWRLPAAMRCRPEVCLIRRRPPRTSQQLIGRSLGQAGRPHGRYRLFPPGTNRSDLQFSITRHRGKKAAAPTRLVCNRSAQTRTQSPSKVRREFGAVFATPPQRCMHRRAELRGIKLAPSAKRKSRWPNPSVTKPSSPLRTHGSSRRSKRGLPS